MALTDSFKKWKLFEFSRETIYSIDMRYNTGCEYHPFNNITISLFGYRLLVRFFNVIPPWRKKIIATSWSKEDKERMGRDYYWEVHERQFGFYLYGDSFNVLYGRNKAFGSSGECKRKHFWLPFKQWRHIRFSIYDLQGKLAYTQLESELRKQRKEAERLNAKYI